MTETDPFTEAWRDHRPLLVDLAYRMLGDIGEAEDVVQEAYSRLLGASLDSIDDLRGWLVVVTSRLCLDQIRSAHARREHPHEAADIDTAGSALLQHQPDDPADRVTLDDSVQRALLALLERLSPAERVVMVLHDVFQMPFGEVADTVGRSVVACRQLASRARAKAGSAAPGRAGRSRVAPDLHRRVTERFITACATGRLEDLLDVLDPDAWGAIDILEAETRGARVIAGNLKAFWGPWVTLVSVPDGDQPTLVAYIDRQLVAVFRLGIAGDRVQSIRITGDPQKLLPLLLEARG